MVKLYFLLRLINLSSFILRLDKKSKINFSNYGNPFWITYCENFSIRCKIQFNSIEHLFSSIQFDKHI